MDESGTNKTIHLKVWHIYRRYIMNLMKDDRYQEYSEKLRGIEIDLSRDDWGYLRLEYE